MNFKLEPRKHVTALLMKAPLLGLPKSRIAAEAGAARALEIYEELLNTLFSNLAGVEGLELWISPAEALDSVARWQRPLRPVYPQPEGGLDTRILRAFESSFDRGADSVVVIGSDCPEITADDLAEAHAQLRASDFTLGPSEDGGYWLIGLKRPASGLFEAIPWSTDRVCAVTEERARALGLSGARLGVKSDIDTLADWSAWIRRRAAAGITARH